MRVEMPAATLWTVARPPLPISPDLVRLVFPDLVRLVFGGRAP